MLTIDPDLVRKLIQYERGLPRPEISDAFIQCVRAVTHENMSRVGRGDDPQRLRDICDGIDRPGRGIDLLRTQLRKNRLIKKFGVTTKMGWPHTMEPRSPSLCFVAETYPLIAKIVKRDIVTGVANIGEYFIVVDASAIIESNSKWIDMLPKKDLFGDVRHMHHLAADEDDSFTTCWSEFGPIIQVSLQELDFPSLFSSIIRYLTVLDTYSPLGDGRYFLSMPFVKNYTSYKEAFECS